MNSVHKYSENIPFNQEQRLDGFKWFEKNIISAKDITEIIGHRTITVMRWAESGKLPKPIFRFGITYVWDKSEALKALKNLGYKVPKSLPSSFEINPKFFATKKYQP